MSDSISPSTGDNTLTNSANSSSPSSSLPSSRQSATQDTRSYLEGLCVAGVVALNDRDYEYRNVYDAISPRFRAYFENVPQPLTLEEYKVVAQQTIERFPEYHIDVQNVSSEIDELQGNAIVYLEGEVTGAPPGTRMVLMNEFRWKRDGGAWLCWLHRGMKGMSEFN